MCRNRKAGSEMSTEDQTCCDEIVTPYFTNSNPLDQIPWVKRNALVTDSKGNTIFQQDDVEAPEFWSQNAVNICAS